MRVTLLDLDPQSSATLACGQEPSPDPWQEASRVLELDGIPEGALEIVPGGRALAQGTLERVHHLLEATGEGRDFVIADTPPGLSPLTLAAIAAASLVLVPVEATPLALTGLGDVAAVVSSLPRPPRLRALLVRVNERRLLTRDVREQLRAAYGRELYRVEVPEDVRAAEAPGFGLPVPCYAPRSRAAEAYAELAPAVLRDLGLARQ